MEPGPTPAGARRSRRTSQRRDPPREDPRDRRRRVHRPSPRPGPARPGRRGRGHRRPVDRVPEPARPVLGDIRLVEGSILDPDALDRGGRRQRGRSSTRRPSRRSPARSSSRELSNSVNAGGTIEVMLAAARHGVRRVVYAGSSSVYGIPAELPCRETMRPDPRSPYGVEQARRRALRPHARRAPRDRDGRPALLQRLRAGPGPELRVRRGRPAVRDGRPRRPSGRRSTATGEISRDFTYIDNVVSANLLAVAPGEPRRRSPATSPAATGSACSSSSTRSPRRPGGRPTRVRAAARRATSATRRRTSRVARREARLRGRSCQFKEGIARTVAWYRDNVMSGAPASGAATAG